MKRINKFLKTHRKFREKFETLIFYPLATVSSSFSFFQMSWLFFTKKTTKWEPSDELVQEVKVQILRKRKEEEERERKEQLEKRKKEEHHRLLEEHRRLLEEQRKKVSVFL